MQGHEESYSIIDMKHYNYLGCWASLDPCAAEKSTAPTPPKISRRTAALYFRHRRIFSGCGGLSE
jgi:hypothetical protein